MSRPNTHWLRLALNIVEVKDSGSFRQSVFEELSRYRRSVRVARAVHRLLGRGRLSSLLIAGYGLKAYLTAKLPRSASPLWAVGAYRNERRQFVWLDDTLGKGAVALVRIDGRTLLSLGVLRAAWRAVRHPSRLRRAFRIISRVNRRFDFLVACRAASTLGYYVRFADELQRRRPSAVVVSTDSNPYGLGLAFAARRHGVPSVYLTHGHIPDGPPRLHYDLSVLDGEAVATVYEETGPIEGRTVFRGAEGDYRPLSTAGLRRKEVTVGIFLSLLTDWPRLSALFTELRRSLRPARIVLRFHPNELMRPPDVLRFFGDLNNVEVSFGESILLTDAEKCDFVIAGNSSCHLTLLKYGVPTVYLDGLDSVPRDFYRFLRHRVVPDCLRVEDVNIEEITRFYEDPDWLRRFAFFDASYPGKDLSAEVRTAVGQLVSRVAL